MKEQEERVLAVNRNRVGRGGAVKVCHHQAGRRVTTVDIRKEAFRLAARLPITDIKGSDCWIKKLMKRSNLSVKARTSVGQPLPHDHKEKIKKFREKVMAEAANIPDYNLGNFDEVPVPFNIVRNRTIDVKGKDNISVVTIGHEKKSNFTVILGAIVSGGKLKPMVIFKRKKMPKTRFPNRVVIRVNPKGWMMEYLMLTWLEARASFGAKRDEFKSASCS